MRHQLDMHDMLLPGLPAPAAARALAPVGELGELLILSCSSTKAPGFTCGHFHDLYTGPMWLQVKASGFPMSRVACVSALYGFMEPDFPPYVETYDQAMDEESAARICGTSNHVARLAACVLAHGRAHLFGGELYRRVGHAACRYRPELGDRLTFATGTYLQQRKQLGEFLRRNTHHQHQGV